jgi:hypothetical protein
MGQHDLRLSAHLWCHKFGCTTECACGLTKPHVLLAKTVIGYLDVTIERKKDVIELEITTKVTSGKSQNRTETAFSTAYAKLFCKTHR